MNRPKGRHQLVEEVHLTLGAEQTWIVVGRMELWRRRGVLELPLELPLALLPVVAAGPGLLEPVGLAAPLEPEAAPALDPLPVAPLDPPPGWAPADAIAAPRGCIVIQVFTLSDPSQQLNCTVAW